MGITSPMQPDSPREMMSAKLHSVERLRPQLLLQSGPTRVRVTKTSTLVQHPVPGATLVCGGSRVYLYFSRNLEATVAFTFKF